ncbi:YbhB/YbcL family Raf kinase inhibitor-like protein [Methanolobus sp. ZRKC3]|uniref:YbhB/YbcL family Raf kinase inhibitor-like protein n=1 Tax=Methanolobus sp. ZRKC3 TaxID=3125786 RepID=UPI003243E583
MRVLVVVLIMVSILISGCTGVEKETLDSSPQIDDTLNDSELNDADVQDMIEMNVSSSAFEHNGMIPQIYTCDGDNINPPLEFGNIPEETRSLAVIVDDPDAPRGTFTHWVVWDIEPGLNIEENSVPGIEGLNDIGKANYVGPCPPSGTHRYFFTVYALDTQLDIEAGASRQDLEDIMEGHILAKGQLMGTYSRK